MPTLDPVQDEVRRSSARFKVCPWGRRRGKSKMGAVLGLEAALERTHGGAGVAWWIWPSHKLGRIGWKQLRIFGHQIKLAIPGSRVFEVERAVTIPGGGEVQMRSADDPETLVGEGLSRAIFDEAGIIQLRAWEESVSPALVDLEGDAFFLGTPKGRGGLFWPGWRRAEDDAETDWAGWHQTTFDSPHLPKAELERLRRDHKAGRIPERVWRQEYLAEFLSDAGAVFRGVATAATAKEQTEAIAGHTYVFGVDWGKQADFTVISVLDVDEQALVYLDRFNRIDYAFQVDRLRSLYDRFLPIEIVAERNSMGEPLVEQIQRSGLPVRPFITTNATKAAAVEAMALAIETGKLRIIPDPVLIGELQAFEGKPLENNRTRYGAPSGLHDDCVLSACIGWTGADQGAMLDLEWA